MGTDRPRFVKRTFRRVWSWLNQPARHDVFVNVTCWTSTGRHDPELATMLDALRRHRHRAAAWYPDVPTPVSFPTYGGVAILPIATVVRLWRKWDDFTGRCPACGRLLLGCGGSGIYSLGLQAVCRSCGLVCSHSDPPLTHRGIDMALDGDHSA